MNIARKNSLSFKLLRWVLATVLLVGLALSFMQIAYDAYLINQQIEDDGQRVLAMFKDPSTQALYHLDKEMGLQVVEGLLHNESIHSASIGHPREAPLAYGSRKWHTTVCREASDLLFSKSRSFKVALQDNAPTGEYYGDLQIVLDTALYGERLLNNAMLNLITSLLRALILGMLLYLVYQALLTRPLEKVIRHLGRINPDRPSDYKLPMLEGYEKNELGLWIKKVNRLLASIERHTHLRCEAEDNLVLLSQIDYLTGLPNRQELQLQLDKIIAGARDKQHGVAVLCLGLDDFKNINDQHNYQIGDWLLQGFAQRLRLHSIDGSCLARLGSDQFMLVQPNVQTPEQAELLAQNILDSLKEPLVMAQSHSPELLSVRLHATIGITLYPNDSDSAELLLQQAEQTMQLAKKDARNRYQFFVASIDLEMRKRRRLKEELNEALHKHQLHVVYQPQMDYCSRKIMGVEALLRWRHPELGMIPPDIFIPLAEQSNQILALGEWVLDQACQQMRDWQDAGITDLTVAVNLSAMQLHHPDLLQQVQEKLVMYNLNAKNLELEITETGLMEDINAAAKNLDGLRTMGVQIAIDDFGTGYSSFSYLKKLPLDKIKIDKSFVQDMFDCEDNATIVKTIIQLSKSLGMKVIAEGVETPEQESFLVELGCDQGQGYWYSKPVTAAAAKATFLS